MLRIYLTLLWISSIYAITFSQNDALRDSLQREYEARIQMSRIDDIYIPKDVYDAFKELDDKTTEASKEKFAAVPEEKVVELMQFRLGFWMKQNWGFGMGSRLTHHMRDFGVQSPDEGVEFLLIGWHRHLNGSELDLEGLGAGIAERRVKAFEEQKKKGKVIHEETRKLSEEEINELLEQKRN